MSDLLASLDFSPAITGAAIGLFLVLLLIWIVSRFLYICGPEEVLIFSGRQRKLASGERIGYQVMFGGRKW